MRLAHQKLHPTELNIHGRKLVGHNGELNANNQVELLQSISALVKNIQGGIVTTASENNASVDRDKRLKRVEALASAYFDRSANGEWQALGEAMAGTLYEYGTREGFMRRILARSEVIEGGVPRIRVPQKSSRAAVATGPSQIFPTYVRDRYLAPPEFGIHTHLLVSEIDMRQTSADLLEEKLVEGQEAIMVREDRLWKQAADALIGVKNDATTISGTLSPVNLSPLMNLLRTNGLSAGTMLMSIDLWTDFSTGTNFQNVYDPVSQYELLQTGYLGKIYGMEFITDGFRPSHMQVLNPGEFYILPAPEYHGFYTDRGPVTANEVNNMQNGKGEMSRGWYMSEVISMGVHNPASVIKAIRV